MKNNSAFSSLQRGIWSIGLRKSLFWPMKRALLGHEMNRITPWYGLNCMLKWAVSQAVGGRIALRFCATGCVSMLCVKSLRIAYLRPDGLLGANIQFSRGWRWINMQQQFWICIFMQCAHLCFTYIETAGQMRRHVHNADHATTNGEPAYYIKT